MSYDKDNYFDEPYRSSELKVNSLCPFNAEPKSQYLISSFLSSNDLFYVRNHAPVPHIDIKSYRLLIDGFVDKAKLYDFDELTNGLKFPIKSHAATLMCAGNRRNEMSKLKKVKGVGWDQGALSTALWSGILLKDVLIDVGVNMLDDSLHVDFEGMDFHLSKPIDRTYYSNPETLDPLFKTLNISLEDQQVQNYLNPIMTSPLSGYGSSIPIHKAAISDECVMLAWMMNGEILNFDHGFPMRVIVPSYIGARSVKWLWRITVSKHESENFYQQRDYKVFPPHVDWDTVDPLWDKYPAIQCLTPQAAICSIIADCNDKKNEIYDGSSDNVCKVPFNMYDVKISILIRGYALTCHGNIAVELSLDEGKNWVTPKLHQNNNMLLNKPNSNINNDIFLNDLSKNTLLKSSISTSLKDAWSFWEYNAVIEIPCQIICRAFKVENGIECNKEQKWPTVLIDPNSQIMPEKLEDIWNLRGVMNNAWHKIKIVYISP
ncbi:uncharacterized protein LOC135927681 [Gordionus sp. m RMFG-2023]|uniref:uncharacterized protein LOC135927681 n=1 Tax=Gordionus sp. m RMFG-2023 TaxID=3053472 RepID=UPI0031FDF430